MRLHMGSKRMVKTTIKCITVVTLLAILMLTLTGCRKEEQAPPPPANAELSFNLSVTQGFSSDSSSSSDAAQSEEIANLEKEIATLQAQIASLQNTLNDLRRDSSDSSNTDQNPVGFIEYLKIGDTEIRSDFSVIVPTSKSGQNVVGVLSSIYWLGGHADPIHFSSQISKANMNTIASMIHRTLGNTEVEFAFSVYDYDSQAKSYYKSFHTNSVPLQGLIQKAGGELAIAIDPAPSSEVTDPSNFRFTLGVVPQDRSQEVQIGVSATDTFSKKWGVEVTK